jgi:hypothetical protein
MTSMRSSKVWPHYSVLSILYTLFRNAINRRKPNNSWYLILDLRGDIRRIYLLRPTESEHQPKKESSKGPLCFRLVSWYSLWLPFCICRFAMVIVSLNYCVNPEYRLFGNVLSWVLYFCALLVKAYKNAEIETRYIACVRIQPSWPDVCSFELSFFTLWRSLIHRRKGLIT